MQILLLYYRYIVSKYTDNKEDTNHQGNQKRLRNAEDAEYTLYITVKDQNPACSSLRTVWSESRFFSPLYIHSISSS